MSLRKRVSDAKQVILAAAVTVALAYVSSWLSQYRYPLEDMIADDQTDIRILASLSSSSKERPRTMLELGRYSEAREKLSLFEFIEQLSFVEIATPEPLHPTRSSLPKIRVVGFDPELLDLFLPHAWWERKQELKPNEIFVVGSDYSMWLPEDGATVELCGRLLVVRRGEFVPSFMAAFDGIRTMGMALPMDRFLALGSQENASSREAPRRFLSYGYYRPGQAGIWEVKIRLKPKFREPQSMADAVQQLQQSLGDGVRVWAPIHLHSELPMHAVAALVALSAFAALLWPALAFVALMHFGRERQKLEAAAAAEGKPLSRRDIARRLWDHASTGSLVGYIAGSILAIGLLASLSYLTHHYIGWLYYDTVMCGRLYPTLGEILSTFLQPFILALAVTLLAALAAALRRSGEGRAS
jgi:hypothetical protein